MPRIALGVVRYSFCFLCLTLTGCSTMGALDAPPSWCTAQGKALAPEREGEDAILKLAETKQELARERSRRRCLQKYAKAVTG